MKSTIFISLAMFLAVASCTPDDDNVASVQSDRLKFNSMDDFHATYSTLAKIQTVDGLQNWANSRNHSTLLSSEDLGIENYSEALKTILNKDFEFEVGDNVIWFNNGTLYSFSKDQVSNREALKVNPESCLKIGSIQLSAIGATSGDLTGGRTATVGLPLDGLDARNQKEFPMYAYRPCGGNIVYTNTLRKYVHEVYNETHRTYPTAYSYQYLRIKLEYKGSKWRPAGEQREINVNVSGTVTPVGFPSMPYSASGSWDCYSGNLLLHLNTVAYGPSVISLPNIAFSMTGSIYHRIKDDDIGNAWTNTEWSPGTGVLW
jgi:hypothetical protein